MCAFLLLAHSIKDVIDAYETTNVVNMPLA
jgi:hypothetical protein